MQRVHRSLGNSRVGHSMGGEVVVRLLRKIHDAGWARDFQGVNRGLLRTVIAVDGALNWSGWAVPFVPVGTLYRWSPLAPRGYTEQTYYGYGAAAPTGEPNCGHGTLLRLQPRDLWANPDETGPVAYPLGLWHAGTGLRKDVFAKFIGYAVEH